MGRKLTLERGAPAVAKWRVLQVRTTLETPAFRPSPDPHLKTVRDAVGMPEAAPQHDASYLANYRQVDNVIDLRPGYPEAVT
jgi:hypothetical protein